MNQVDSVEETELYRDYLREDSYDDVNTYLEYTFLDEKAEPLLQSKVHEELQTFVRENQFGVIELHRECGKTTQMIGLASHIIGQNADERIKIVSNSDNEAVKRGKATREIVESPGYHEIFPDRRPGREWTDKKFSVERNIISPESSLECYGVQSRATGGRCDWLFLDDTDDEEVVVSEVKRDRNKERVLNVWLNLLTPTGKAFMFCTPWHKKDTAHKLKENGWPVFHKPVVNMKPVFPERWDAAALRKRKRTIGSLAFARGFELIPISSESAPIKGHWFNLWTKLPRFTSIGIACDPNNSLSEGSNFTAIGVFGVTWDYQVYLLEVFRAHLEFPGVMSTIKKMAEQAEKRYKIRPYIGVEDTAYQKAIPLMLKKETPYPIFGLKADKGKFIRASRFAVQCENGRVNLKAGKNNTIHPEQVMVYDNCVEYPACANDDLVDMMGYGVEMMLRVARRGGAVVGGK